MKDYDYPLYIINIEKKTYEKVNCSSEEERYMVEHALGAVTWAFDEEIGDKICIKYVEPEFEEVE